MAISLRDATADDEAIIRGLILRNNLNPFDIDWRSFIVAEDAQQNFVGCGQIRRHGGIEELASLMVKDEWQGQGIASLLMEALLGRSDRPLWLMCESTLTGYYKQFGFEEVINPLELPPYFQGVYWFSRVPMGLIFFIRGTHLAFMVLREG